uniref:3',5'-cyclic-GMP phosphodiesterase n=1 Tax=Xiphophorus couchianus TaxID=32473 RepID=A0A3B5KYT7_9TELE
MNSTAAAAAAANMNASSVPEAGKPSPAELKQKDSRQFKSKAPKPGQKSFDSPLPGMEGLDDAAVICPWEEFGDVELSDLAQFGTA